MRSRRRGRLRVRLRGPEERGAEELEAEERVRGAGELEAEELIRFKEAQEGAALEGGGAG